MSRRLLLVLLAVVVALLVFTFTKDDPSETARIAAIVGVVLSVLVPLDDNWQEDWK